MSLLSSSLRGESLSHLDHLALEAAFGVEAQETEFKQMVREAAYSTALTAVTFFPHHFTIPFSPVQRPVFRLMDDPILDFVALAEPRGWGKTSLVDIALLSRHALYQIPPLSWIPVQGYKPFCVLISNTYDQAIEQLDTFKTEIETNEKVRITFGDQVGRIWREDRIELANGSYIVAKGAGQQVRGIKHGKNRPSLIILDDLENSEQVKSEERRKKNKKWLMSDVMYAGANSGKDCKKVFIGTILHEDSLLQNVLDDESIESCRLEAFDDNLNPTWPEKESKEDIETAYALAESMGTLTEFMQEKRNLVIAVEDAAFRKEIFKKYGPGDRMYEMALALIDKNQCPRCVIVDPARTVNTKSDPTGMLGLIIDIEAGTVLIHDLLNAKLEPEDIVYAAFDMADRLKTNRVFVKNTGLELWSLATMRSVMLRRGTIYDIQVIPERGKKEERIAKAAPLYRSGIIHHNTAVCTPLEAQLVTFPRSARDDLSDCVGDIPWLINEVGGWDYTPVEELSPTPYEDYEDADFDDFDPCMANII